MGLEKHILSGQQIMDLPTEPCRVDTDDSGVRLSPYHPVQRGCDYYTIEWDRLTCPEDLLHWIQHLTGKNWMTMEMVNDLITLVSSHRGWDILTRNV